MLWQADGLTIEEFEFDWEVKEQIPFKIDFTWEGTDRYPYLCMSLGMGPSFPRWYGTEHPWGKWPLQHNYQCYRLLEEFLTSGHYYREYGRREEPFSSAFNTVNFAKVSDDMEWKEILVIGREGQIIDETEEVEASKPILPRIMDIAALLVFIGGTGLILKKMKNKKK